MTEQMNVGVIPPTAGIDKPNTEEPPKPKIRIPDQAVPHFKILRKLCTNKAKAEHHHKFLEQCLKDETSPRGLQPKIRPQVGEPTLEFTLIWEQTLSRFSRELTNLLYNHYTERISTLEHQIDVHKSPLEKTCNQDQIDYITELIGNLVVKQTETLKQQRTTKSVGGSKSTNKPTKTKS